MNHRSADSNDNLDDSGLLLREAHDLQEYQQLAREQPHYRDTTYGLIHGSSALVSAWERWWGTNMAARLRGLLPSSSR